ncbi:Uncharacterised protein [Mycobacteroides abscessus subsp. abscessus]|nr:Uncharacterised protein [Mycobacteroides abscessus subsp. abscessus]
MPTDGRTWLENSHPAFWPFLRGNCSLTSRGSSKNFADISKAWLTSAMSMPWSTTWKKPISVAADQSSSAICARRCSKSARLMRRTSRSVVSVPTPPICASRLSSVIAYESAEAVAGVVVLLMGVFSLHE